MVSITALAIVATSKIRNELNDSIEHSFDGKGDIFKFGIDNDGTNAHLQRIIWRGLLSPDVAGGGE